MERTPENFSKGAVDLAARKPYNALIRELGDALAARILTQPATYTSPGGKQVYFLPTFKSILTVWAMTGKTGIDNGSLHYAAEVARHNHIAIAACKAITRLSTGDARARTILLDGRFDDWRDALNSDCQPVTDFPELVERYCAETGERIERREESAGPELGLRGEVVTFPGDARPKRVHPASLAAYREAFATAIAAYGTASAQQKCAALVDSAAAEWVAKQEGR